MIRPLSKAWDDPRDRTVWVCDVHGELEGPECPDCENES